MPVLVACDAESMERPGNCAAGTARVVAPPAAVAAVPAGMARVISSQVSPTRAAPAIPAPAASPRTATGPTTPAAPTGSRYMLLVPTRPDEFSSWLRRRKAGWRDEREARRIKNGVFLSNSPFPAWLADRKAEWRERRGRRNPPEGRRRRRRVPEEDSVARAERASRFRSNHQGWDVMFPALCEYAEREKRNSKDGETWSGHVPSLYKFERPGMPTLSLGNW